MDQMEDFDVAFAYEIFARANTACGHEHNAREYWELARIAGNQIEDDQHRDIYFADLNSSNWLYLYSDKRSTPLVLAMMPLEAGYSYDADREPYEFLEGIPHD